MLYLLISLFIAPAHSFLSFTFTFYALYSTLIFHCALHTPSLLSLSHSLFTLYLSLSLFLLHPAHFHLLHFIFFLFHFLICALHMCKRKYVTGGADFQDICTSIMPCTSVLDMTIMWYEIKKRYLTISKNTAIAISLKIFVHRYCSG